MNDIEWIKIPSGPFLMGLSVQQLKQLGQRASVWKEEVPQRVVDVPTFYISKYPITNYQFSLFVAATGLCRDVRFLEVTELANHPVDCHYLEATAFCQWRGTRLPTSTEWEKAARGLDGRLYPWGNRWELNRGNFGQRNVRGRIRGYRTTSVDAYPEGSRFC